MARKNKRGVKLGTKRGPYKKAALPNVVKDPALKSIYNELEEATANVEASIKSATQRIRNILKV